MSPWQPPIVANLLVIGVLLGAAAWLRNRIGPLQRIGIPDAIVAGAVGLLLGPSVLDVAPFDREQLEDLVYHGFAIVFIAVALQRPPPAKRSAGTRSVMVAIPSLSILQILIGFAFVALFAGAVHPAFGFLPMLGFSQGPGQALSIGGSWEALGLENGGQLGLVFAALGFGVCCAIGIPLIAIGRRLGWDRTPGFDEAGAEDEVEATATTTPTPATEHYNLGQMEPLTVQLVAIVIVYSATFGFIYALTRAFPEGSPFAATLWGFHFIAGALIAITVRRLAIRFGRDQIFDDALLARISVVAVDFTTVAALSAVALGVLGRWLLPIVLITVTCSALTLLASLWMSRRVFGVRPFEHAVAMFGMSTGTLPTGLALLRALDPGLRGPAARNMALGATASIPLMAPMVAGLLPFSVTLWAHGFWISVGVPVGLAVVYAIALAVAWRKLTPVRSVGSARTLWPD